MRKLLALFLALCMICSLASCGKDGSDASDSTLNGSDSGEGTPEGVVLIENGVAQYGIVYEDSKFEDAAFLLQDELTRKTGVKFKANKFEVKDYERFIYIGHDYNDLQIDEKHLTYSGYAVVPRDGDLYICGYQKDVVTLAVQKFNAHLVPEQHVTKGNDGKTSRAVIPASSFLFYNPDYAWKNPKLLDAPLSEYRVVISDNANPAVKELSTILIEEIGRQTGFLLEKVTDATTPRAREIVIGETTRAMSAELMDDLKAEEFRLKSSESSVYLAYGSFLSYSDAVSELKTFCDEAEETSIDLNDSVDETYGLYKSDESKMRIMSSNVLFYHYYNLAGYLSAAARQYVNADCYLTYLPDIIGGQEICDDNARILDSELGELYSAVHTGGPAIYYLKDKYKVEETKHMKFEHAGACVWARFSSLSDPETQFIVMSLHYSPYALDTRMPGVKQVNAELKALQELYPTMPIIIPGDYNSRLDSVEHQTMVEGLANPMCPARKVAANLGSGTTVVDFIFVTTDFINVEQYHVILYPTIYKASDHKPVLIDITFKN